MNDSLKHIVAWVLAALIAVAAATGLWLWLRPKPGTPPVTDRFSVKGIDLSAHNGDVDFDKIRLDGYEFVYLKSSEGTRFKDAGFEKNAAAARKAGLKVGAYHFFRFDSPAYMQALNLMQSVRMQHLDLPLVIDIEQWTNPAGHSADSVLHHAAQMAALLEKQGYKVMFYTNKRGQARWVRRELKKYPLWLCSLSNLDNPEVCTIWQHSHTGKVNGVKGNVDLNVFCGSRSQWRSWLHAIRQAQ